MKTIKKFYNTIAVPMVLNRAQIQSLTKEEDGRLDVIEIVRFNLSLDILNWTTS